MRRTPFLMPLLPLFLRCDEAAPSMSACPPTPSLPPCHFRRMSTTWLCDPLPSPRLLLLRRCHHAARPKAEFAAHKAHSLMRLLLRHPTRLSPPSTSHSLQRLSYPVSQLRRRACAISTLAPRHPPLLLLL